MSDFDTLHEDELAARVYAGASAPMAPTPEPSVWDDPFKNVGGGTLDMTMAGFAKMGRNIALTASTPLMLFDEYADAPGGTANLAFEAIRTGLDQGDKYSPVRYWSPKPGEVGIAGQVLGSLGQMGAEATLGGPLGVVAQEQFNQSYDVAMRDGSTAAVVGTGVVRGLTTGVGLKLPGALVEGRLANAGVMAAVNAAAGVIDRAAISAILNADDMHAMANEYDAFDPVAMTIDATLGTALGAVFGRSRAAQPLVDPINKAARDAAQTLNLHNEQNQGLLLPLEEYEAARTREAAQDALDGALRGEGMNMDPNARISLEALNEAHTRIMVALAEESLPNERILVHGTTEKGAAAIMREGFRIDPLGPRVYDYSDFGMEAAYLAAPDNGFWTVPAAARAGRGVAYPKQVTVALRDANVRTINTPEEFDALARELGYSDGLELGGRLSAEGLQGMDESIRIGKLTPEELLAEYTAEFGDGKSPSEFLDLMVEQETTRRKGWGNEEPATREAEMQNLADTIESHRARPEQTLEANAPAAEATARIRAAGIDAIEMGKFFSDRVSEWEERTGITASGGTRRYPTGNQIAVFALEKIRPISAKDLDTSLTPTELYLQAARAGDEAGMQQLRGQEDEFPSDGGMIDAPLPPRDPDAEGKAEPPSPHAVDHSPEAMTIERQAVELRQLLDGMDGDAIIVGFDAEMNAITQPKDELLEEIDRAIEDAKNQGRAFEVAATCYLGG